MVRREFLVWALRMEGRRAEALQEAAALTMEALPCAVKGCVIPGCHSHGVKQVKEGAGRRYERFAAAYSLTAALLGGADELRQLDQSPCAR